MLIASIVVSAIIGAISVFCFLTAYRHHKEKGFIFTERWIFASLKDREQMDHKAKKFEYRVGRNVFILAGLIFLFIAIYVFFYFSWLIIVVYVLLAIAIIYGFTYLVRLWKNTMSNR